MSKINARKAHKNAHKKAHKARQAYIKAWKAQKARQACIKAWKAWIKDWNEVKLKAIPSGSTKGEECVYSGCSRRQEFSDWTESWCCRKCEPDAFGPLKKHMDDMSKEDDPMCPFCNSSSVYDIINMDDQCTCPECGNELDESHIELLICR